MKCPSCGFDLKEVRVFGLKIPVCRGGCGGLWFDRYEFSQLKTDFEGEGESLLNIERAEGVRFYRDVEPICPKCQTTLLFRHFFSKLHDVEVEQCAKCGGFWVDPGELATLRARFPDAEKRKRAAEDYFQAIFDERIARMDLMKQDVVDSAKIIVTLFLFICPKEHLPRKSPI